MNKDYIELEYIESTGTQYIDTGFVLKSTSDIEFEFAYISASWSNDWVPLAGVRNMPEPTDNPVYTFFIHTTNRNVSSEYAGIDFGEGNIGNINGNQKYIFRCKNKKFYLNEDEDHNNYTTNNLDDSLMVYSCYIFGMNTVNSPDIRNLCMKLYSFKIYDNNVIVRDLIPAKRKSDNEIGLYDSVNGVFYTNSGTGEFIAGPEIPEPTLHENVSLINTQISNLKSLTDEILGTIPGPEIVPFATATDEQISALLDAHYNGKIDLSEIWNVGDTRVIHLDAMSAPVPGSNKAHVAQDMTFRIIGFNHDNLTTQIGNVTKAAVTIECKELLGNYGTLEGDYLSASSNGSAYENPVYFDNAYRRTWLNNNFISALPATFKTLVKEVVKRNLQGHSNTTNYIETNDKAFFLSYPEMFSSTYSYYRSGATLNDYEGTQYTYYSQNDSNAERIKYVNNNGSASSAAKNYWLRSPSSYGSRIWFHVDTDGSVNIGRYDYTRGVAPALAI